MTPKDTREANEEAMSNRLYIRATPEPYAPLLRGLMELREVFFLIGENQTILWSDASDSPVLLPDSRTRWEEIWSRRVSIIEIAHSHPVGPLGFSREDETTMRALVKALGRPIVFSVVAPDGMVRRTEPVEPSKEPAARVTVEPWWTALLRLASGMVVETRPPLSKKRTAKKQTKKLSAKRTPRNDSPPSEVIPQPE